MKAWDQFFPDLLVDLPECPQPLVTHALKRAAQDFFKQTLLWKVWLEPMRTANNINEYELEVEPHTELVRIERATLDGRPIVISTASSMPTDWKTNPLGIEDCIFSADGKNFTLIPYKDGGLVLLIEASLRPSDSAVGIEDNLFNLYSETIALGAKARLLRQPAKPYSDPGASLDAQVLFENAIGRIGIQQFRGFSSALPRRRITSF
jgi:hypothetical protein